MLAPGMARVDLHFHLLPGVDDGPSSVEESIELAWAAVADGAATVIATPHIRSDFVTDVSELDERLRDLRAALWAERVPLEVRLGGELGHEMVGRLCQRELETVAQGPPGARWLLVEAPFDGIGEDFHAATAELRSRGLGVVVAHPERSADAALHGASGLRRELAAGSLAQVNAMSLAGGHGGDAERAARELVASGLVAVVASDAHGPTRPPALRRAERAMLAQRTPEGVARALTGSATRSLLARGMPRARLAA
jgi:protein-tyrosine phosphatase